MSTENKHMLPIGTTLQNGKYIIERHLASGGFGNTYVVTETAFDERMAMKEFFMSGITERLDDSSVSVSNDENQDQFDLQSNKFKKEARRLRNLNTPHVVHVHDLFEENGTVYYVMDYIEGESLAARLKRQGPLSEREVYDVFHQVIDALEAVHAQNIWHLDLKPGNIMVDKQGQCFLIDFGASKQRDVVTGYEQTSTELCFTRGFAPIEQISGNMERFGPWTDFYALGATLYNLLTNERPPDVDTVSDGVAAFKFPPSVSPRMKELIVWLMKSDCRQRPQSVADIRRWLKGTKVAPQPKAAVQDAGRHQQANNGVATVMHASPKAPAPRPRQAPAPMPSQKINETVPPPRVYVSSGSGQSKSPWPLIAIVGLLLVVIVAAILFLLSMLGLFSSDKNTQQPNDTWMPYDSIVVQEPVGDNDAENIDTPTAYTPSNRWHDLGHGSTIHHHFEGSMTDHTGPHPIELDFDYANNGSDQLSNVVYKNVTFGGTIRMTGQIFDDLSVYLHGYDGNSEFTMDFSMKTWKGDARVGEKQLKVALQPACNHD